MASSRHVANSFGNSYSLSPYSVKRKKTSPNSYDVSFDPRFNQAWRMLLEFQFNHIDESFLNYLNKSKLGEAFEVCGKKNTHLNTQTH